MSRRRLLALLVAPVALLGFAPTTAMAVVPDNAAAQKLIVKFRDGAPAADRTAALREAGATRVTPLLLADTVALEAPGAGSLAGHRAVEYVEYDAPMYASAIPNDPLFRELYGIHNTGQTGGTADADIDGTEATDVTGGNGVIVDILDTGIDSDHEDLTANVVGAVNFTGSPTAEDHYGHGTHVAGTVAAVTGNGLGVAGVAPNARLRNVKVLSDSGSGSNSGIANGITWSADNGAKVINMSLGGSVGSTTLQRAVDYAWNKGVVLVAAAGNSGSSAKHYPAAYTNVIAVAATDHNDKKASFSNYGSRWVDVAAPGLEIMSTMPNHSNTIGPQDYAKLSGTSMASPHVAGVAALTWSSSFGTSAQAVRTGIEGTSDKLAGTAKLWAHGRVNAHRAVTGGP